MDFSVDSAGIYSHQIARPNHEKLNIDNLSREIHSKAWDPFPRSFCTSLNCQVRNSLQKNNLATNLMIHHQTPKFYISTEMLYFGIWPMGITFFLSTEILYFGIWPMGITFFSSPQSLTFLFSSVFSETENKKYTKERSSC